MRFIVALGILLAPCTATARGQPSPFEPPTDAEVQEQARRLDPKNDRKTRLQALSWLNGRSRAKNAALAIPALETCIRKDPDMECRRDAVWTLAMIAGRLGRPCPRAVIESFLDKEDEPRWMAMAHLGPFKSYEPGAVEILLRGAGSEKPGARSDSLLILARAGPKDKRALEAIDKGKRDRTFEVRHTAHVAWFAATDRLEDYLIYIIRVREDAEAALTPVPKDPEAAKGEQAMRNVFVIGAAIRTIEWSDKRAVELATVLMKLLDDKSVVMRRGAVNLIGAVVVKVDLPEPKEGASWLSQLLPYVEAGKKPDPSVKKMKEKPPQPSRAAGELKKRDVQARLTTLRDKDPDRTVREAAARALERLASVSDKKR